MQDEDAGNTEFRRSAELQSQMEKIGGRFLDRVLADFDAMEKLLAALASGDAAASTALEMFAHRIHGSSAIFGFSSLSEAAGALEALLGTDHVKKDPVASLQEVVDGMAAVRAAAEAARGASAAR